MGPDTRRLMQLTIKNKDHTDEILDYVVSKKTCSRQKSVVRKERKFSRDLAFETDALHPPQANGIYLF